MPNFKLILFFLTFHVVLNAQSTLVRSEMVSFHQLDFAQARTQADGDAPYFYRFGHFDNIPTSQERARLEAQGVVFVDYFLNSTYLLAFQHGVAESLCKSIGMDGLVEIPTRAKLSQKVKERPIPEWALARNGQIRLIVKGYKTSSPTEFQRLFESLDIALDFAGRRQCYVELTIDEDQIDVLASLPQVSFIDWIDPPAVLDDDNGRGMHRSNVLNTNYAGGRHYDGTGVNVLVRDDGSVGPHIDFQGRVTQVDPSISGGGSHGDMVAGIFVGAGNIEPTFKGMATGAHLFVKDYNSNFQTYTMDLHQNENVVVTSSSYSNGCNAGYTALTHTIDQQIFDNQTLIHIFSAGNAGSNDCGYGVSGWGNITGGHKQGKNAIATGNLTKSVGLAISSSRGPAYDGRIKPDLCAHGQEQMSTDPDNTYNPGGGTSAASPGAAGVFTQLIHAYKTINGGAEPKSGLIKACLLNTAIDLGNVGPDFKYGWGELNGYRAVKTLENHDYSMSSIDQGQSNTHTINVPNGMTQVRFMLYWMDPPAPADAPKALINNLDLKVVSPAGDTILPWVLNYAANAASLNLPATHGMDDLNNMEQVVFQTPDAGDYKILVKGTEVPMGPQEYFVLHSAVQEPLFMAYPVGGESFAPGENIRIFWDAYDLSTSNFDVEVSFDNGSSWTSIVQTTDRSFLWTVPNHVTGDGLIRVSRDGHSAQSITTFSILDRPKSLSVDTVCASFAYISWDAVAGATEYDLYVLGDKYMDSVGTTTNTGIYLPITSPFEGFWYSVRAKGANGLQSERAYAKYYAGGLLDCQLTYDLSLDNIIGINGEDITQCDSQIIPIKATIRNKGKVPMTNISIVYTKNNNSPVTVPYNGTIDAGQSIIWDAMDTIQLIQSGQYSLSVTVIQNDDELMVNNSIDYSFNVENLALTSNSDVSEDFEDGVFPPEKWALVGTVNEYSWMKKDAVIGIDGLASNVVWVDNYKYDNSGEIVSITTRAVNTDTVAKLKLSFDYAYTNFDDNYSDTMEVIVFDVCNSQKGEQQLFYKGGDDLRTIPSAVTSKWEPDSADDWKHEEMFITGYLGGNVKVKFKNINGFGNSLYLDNIQLNPSPVVGVLANQTATCLGDSIVFSTDYLGDSLTYSWSFDDGGSNVTTSGPHTIVYTTPGQKNVQLAVTGPNGISNYSMPVQVVPLPIASFSSTFAGQIGTFTSTASDALTYLWDFGDGDVGTLINPVHTFSDTGSYTVCLTVTNDCGADTICQNVDILTGNKDLQAVFPGIQLTPNPATDYVSIANLSKMGYDLAIDILDMTGRVVGTSTNLYLQIGERKILDVSDLPSGIYWVKLMSWDQVAFAKIVIE